MKNRELRWLYLKTGMVGALTAMTVGLRIDIEWASCFALAALFGWLNWFLLGLGLVAFTERRPARALGALAAKLVLIGTVCFGLLPRTVFLPSAFVCGFTLFFIIALLEGVSVLILPFLTKGSSPRHLPKDWRTLLLGTTPDA